MAKVINLKQSEEITSVIERLWETGEEEVFFVVPPGAGLLRNIIGLKLLRREAERLGKEVVLITKDGVGREMAKRAGLASKVALPKSEAADDEDVLKDVSLQKFETLIEEEVKLKRRTALKPVSMNDIRPKQSLMAGKQIVALDKEEVAEKLEEVAQSTASLAQEIKDSPPLEELIQEGMEAMAVNDGLKRESIDLEDQEDSFPIKMMARNGFDLSDSDEERASKRKSFLTRFFAPRHLAEVLVAEPRLGRRPARRAFSRKLLVIFGGAALLVAGLALFYILPRAEVMIKPKSQDVTQNLNIVADKSINKIDSEKNKIPAQLIKLDRKETKEFSASGQRQVNEKAKGIITIFNEFSSTSQSLVEKTRFVSDSGKTFRLAKSVVVPGAKIQDGKIVASSIDAEVVADEAGKDYNIGPSRFTIPGFAGTPKFDAFYGQSKSAMVGGATGLMTVVSQEDIDKAKVQLWAALQPLLENDFKEQLPAGLKIIDGATKKEISSTSVSVEAGQPAEKFTLTLKGSMAALFFDEKNLLALAESKLADQLSNNQKFLVPDGQIEYQSVFADFNKNQLNFKVKISGKIVWQINEETIKKSIAGKKENEVRQIFNQYQEIENAQVSLWPFWVRSVPSSQDKIKIIVKLD